MRGKYSPTVSAAYMEDQEWFEKYAGENAFVDKDGFDSYGYDNNDRDRAGNQEHEYYPDDCCGDSNYLYEKALNEWGFDGIKPVRKS